MFSGQQYAQNEILNFFFPTIYKNDASVWGHPLHPGVYEKSYMNLCGFLLFIIEFNEQTGG